MDVRRLWSLVADLLNRVEATGRWADALLDGFVYLIEKDPNNPDPDSLDQRGIGILSHI